MRLLPKLAEKNIKGLLMKKIIHDVALSFSGEQREFVEQVALLLREFGVKVFYDNFEKTTLWGKDLYQYLHEIYFSSRYTVVFLSSAYKEKLWTRHELRSMQSRAFHERGEYILPIYIEDVEIPGIPKTIGHVDMRGKTPVDIALMVLDKISKKNRSSGKFFGDLKFKSDDFFKDILERISNSMFSTIISVYKDGAPAIEVDYIQIGPRIRRFNSCPVVAERNAVTLKRSMGFCGFMGGVLYVLVNHKDYPPTTYLLKPFSASRETIIANNAFSGLCLDVTAKPSCQIMSARVLFIRNSVGLLEHRYHFEGSKLFDAAHPFLKNTIGRKDAWLHFDHIRAPDLAGIKKTVKIFNPDA